MTGKEAEKILMQYELTCYLIRFCKNKNNYMLSVQCQGRAYHFGIKVSGSGNCTYAINGSEKDFKSCLLMLRFYQKHPLNGDVSDIGQPINQLLYKSSFEDVS